MSIKWDVMCSAAIAAFLKLVICLIVIIVEELVTYSVDKTKTTARRFQVGRFQRNLRKSLITFLPAW